MKTALLIAYACPPENTVGGVRPFRFARYLPDFGYGLWQSQPPYSLVRHLRGCIIRRAEGIAVPPVAQYPAFAAATEFWRREKPDVVFSAHPPISTHS